jgi:hypothetical protein
MHTNIERRILVLRRAHQHVDLVYYLAPHYPYQPYLANRSAAIVGGLKVYSSKGGSGHVAGGGLGTQRKPEKRKEKT